MNWADLLWVGLAGSVGAVARFLVDGAIRSRSTTRVPWGTVIINVSGSLVAGVLAGIVVFHGAPATLQLVAVVGFLGGYTTFSTASYETVRLIQGGDGRAAVANAAGNLAGSLLGAALGLALASL